MGSRLVVSRVQSAPEKKNLRDAAAQRVVTEPEWPSAQELARLVRAANGRFFLRDCSES